ncbi:hypothetical protein BT96DRAFT_330203 [Gymnopus androsaceus JB14]|uniref:Uncharacterized protein n=1 Tax=Gymnopus androsaceus JB14 TaxID=1447944 RepID=A0A6A4I6V2_9AGAR|nr:hypothetical protein BT96DRAFT_330203 [Gymnopus androsaceus JB14]
MSQYQTQSPPSPMVTTPTENRACLPTALFRPGQVGDMLLQNHIVVAPLTRFRVSKEHVPHTAAIV